MPLSEMMIGKDRSALRELKSHEKMKWGNNAYNILHDARFESALDKVTRWQNSVINPPETFRESNLDHVRGMEKLFSRLVTSHSPLAKEVDPFKVDLMIRVHDAGEILTGDYPPLVSPELQKKKERSEPLAITLMTRNLKEPVKGELRDLFHDYHERKSKEALMTKWLDVAQGNETALNNNLYETIATYPEKRFHLAYRVGELIYWSGQVAKNFERPDSVQEIKDLQNKQLEQLKQHGYGEHFNKYGLVVQQ